MGGSDVPESKKSPPATSPSGGSHVAPALESQVSDVAKAGNTLTKKELTKGSAAAGKAVVEDNSNREGTQGKTEDTKATRSTRPAKIQDKPSQGTAETTKAAANTNPAKTEDGLSKQDAAARNDLRDSTGKNGNDKLRAILRKNPAYANLKISSDEGTVLHWILRNGRNDDNSLKLLETVFKEAKETVDWNTGDKNGRTALHLACGNRRCISVADFLLYKCGANPNIADKAKEAPLHGAITDGKPDRAQVRIVEMLLKHPKIRPGLEDKSGRTALHEAASRGYVVIARLIVRRDPKTVNQTDSYGHTPLYDACTGDHHQVTRVLIQAGANLAKPTHANNTPLHHAADYNALKVGRMLLDRGVSTSPLNHENKTALDLAEDKGHTEFVNLLKELGLDAKVANSKVKLALKRPKKEQESICVNETFRGIIWSDAKKVYDDPKIWDMLYEEIPLLKDSWAEGGFRWIHVPSNNVSGSRTA
jgi:ankyrin repeat protein